MVTRYVGVTSTGTIVAPPEVLAYVARYLSGHLRADERLHGGRLEAIRQAIEALEFAATVAVSEPVPQPEPEPVVPVRLVSTAEAATRMGCSEEYVRRLARQGRIKAHRVGTAWAIDLNDIDRQSPRRAA